MSNSLVSKKISLSKTMQNLWKLYSGNENKMHYKLLRTIGRNFFDGLYYITVLPESNNKLPFRFSSFRKFER